MSLTLFCKYMYVYIYTYYERVCFCRHPLGWFNGKPTILRRGSPYHTYTHMLLRHAISVDQPLGWQGKPTRSVLFPGDHVFGDPRRLDIRAHSECLPSEPKRNPISAKAEARVLDFGPLLVAQLPSGFRPFFGESLGMVPFKVNQPKKDAFHFFLMKIQWV